MEAAEIIVVCEIWPEHLHLVVQAIVDDEGVGHPDAMRFHGVSLAVVVVANIRVVEVGNHALLSLTSSCSQRIPPTLHYKARLTAFNREAEVWMVFHDFCESRSRSRSRGEEIEENDGSLSVCLSVLLALSVGLRGPLPAQNYVVCIVYMYLVFFS